MKIHDIQNLRGRATHLRFDLNIRIPSYNGQIDIRARFRITLGTGAK